MKTWRKEISLLLVGLMIMSGLVAISAPAIADHQMTLNNVTWTVDYNDTNMINHTGINDADEKLVINEVGNGAADTLLYLGDRDQVLRFQIQPSVVTWANHTVTIGPASGNTLITVDLSNNDQSIRGWPNSNTTWYTVDFQIDIENQGDVETTYEMTCTIRNDNTSATTQFSFWIYVSSVFHDDTNDDTGETTHEFTRVSGEYIIDAWPNDPEFEAGAKFVQADLGVRNYAGFPIRNPQANLSAPTDNGNANTLADITLVRPNCLIQRDIIGGALVQDAAGNNLTWRLNVEERTPPGVTDGTVIIHYQKEINDVYTPIRENVRPIDFAVDFTFRDQDITATDGGYSPLMCYATSVVIIDDGTVTRQVNYDAPYDIPTLEQSTDTDRKIRVNVTIVNNGNTELYNVVFAVYPDTWDAAGGFFRNPRFFYHETGVLDNDGITLSIDLLNVNQTVNFTIEMIVENDIPIGEHRLPIEYDGYYYDNAELGGATSFVAIGDGDITTTADNLEIVFSIMITDSAIACHAGLITLAGAGDKGNIIAETITVPI
ncbi:MAG: hypothetical protein Q7J68_07210, partial [Thermoplasmata archaeon]|nr:hypothetical protein [Thermoplasmata archaeon]